jgi:hypothetical protein
MAAFSRTIRSLMVSSLGLPGMQELLAQDLPEEGVDYRFTRYEEEPLPVDKLAFGDPRRYEIDSHQFRIHRNFGDEYSLELGYHYETMSGSSPWYVVPGDTGPLQVMSGATISERRHQADLAGSYRHGRYGHRVNVGFSTENDYQAVYGGYSGEVSDADRSTTAAWGISFSQDEVTPTDAELFGRVLNEDRDSLSVSASLSQVINRNSVIQSGVSITQQTGYLSDPYKQMWINRSVLNDSRPDERHLFSWTTRYRLYIERTRGALNLDYRFFRDDWEIRSHTLEVSFKQPLAERWELAPSIRYYAQSDAFFYAPYLFEAPSDGFWSSDFRLSAFGALSYRLHASYRHPRFSLSAGAEYYDSDASLALGQAGDAPALVDFWRFTAAFRWEL